MITRTTRQRETLEERIKERAVDDSLWFVTHATKEVRSELDRLARKVRKLKQDYLSKRPFSDQTKKRLAYVLALTDVIEEIKSAKR